MLTLLSSSESLIVEPKDIFTLKNHPAATRGHKCRRRRLLRASVSCFLPAGPRKSGRGPAEGKSLAKSEPAVFLLRASGCLCVRPKGMGGTSFAFPFLTLFSYFWMHVYLNTHTCVCAYLFFSFFFRQVKAPKLLSFSWDCLCMYVMRPGLRVGPSHSVTRGALPSPCF